MRRQFGSDLVVDALRSFGVTHVAFNPGASFRGLHESLVTAGSGGPTIIEVPHEKIAIGIAHGYAKASGQPMAVVIHDLVGLLHATLGIYYAYADRVPMMVLGGAGPMDAAVRRPWIDWVHSANIQNTAVRDYTKWDDYPASNAALVDSMARAQTIAMTEPAGPVYVAVDSELQEQEIPEELWPTMAVPRPPSRLAPDPAALDRVADALASAHRPMFVAGSVGRDPAMWQILIDLAEMLGAGVVDTGLRPNFPTCHPLNQTGTTSLAEADVVVLLDVKDIGQHTSVLTKRDRGGRPRLADGATLVDIGFADIGISSWSADYGSWYEPDERVVADTSLALPQLLSACRGRMTGDDGRRQPWRSVLERRSVDRRRTWQEAARAADPRGGITSAQLVIAVGEAIAGHDWVLTAGTGDGWAPRLWDFDHPGKHPGRSLGTATQIGISLGVALAHKGSGKLVVDLQPDGDLLFDASALWVAAKYDLPMLAVMVNNRAYNNDWNHQLAMADRRSTPREAAEVGITIDDPAVDFATLATSFGWHAEGPVTDVDALPAALERAVKVVRSGRPALLDVVCWPERAG
ncbi:MAG: acetolactate synthase large subunit [Mycobacterium sp.]|jgi:acetolactate synthase-1/2/3 large subunit|nr:acetolactate synthase large subunit [Mycobacterium sp.]MDT5241441.1 acetolactate synthase large subunit [Mycobacterium sp.]